MKCNESRLCFAKDILGNCEILSDTNFNYSCPFWKPPVSKVDDTEYEIEGFSGKFKKIPGYEYYISTEGIVINKHHKVKKATFDNSKCCLTVSLSKNGRVKAVSLALLVANAFIPGTERVHFKNGDRQDCRLENLERW